MNGEVRSAGLETTEWWKGGLIYQIYVRSFFDSNDDGIGDLQGVIAKLDYLQELGVDGIWLSPITVSANADWGYDVIDYYNVDPDLGTLEDFDQLIAEAHSRSIKVITDFVPNHTSTKHPWFQNALTGRGATYRDWYIWADPKYGRRPPSNWRSAFGGGAWKYHPSTKQYYLHNFLTDQADLNWRNPKVRQEFEKIMKFWFGRGVDGFRIDVFNMLIKDDRFRDNPGVRDNDGLEVKLLGQRPVYNISRPELHDILKSWRDIAESYKEHKLLLGESTLLYNVRQLASYYGSHDELQLAFNLMFIHTPFRAKDLRRVVERTEAAIVAPDWPVWTGSNHDQPRFPSRWAAGDPRRARLALMMLLTLRGTPVLYYGDEIGLVNTNVPPWKLKDPVGRRLWPIYPGRDRARTPMPWADVAGGGFTDPDVTPWLPFGDLNKYSVGTQWQLKDSTWNFTRDLVALRRRLPDLQTGRYGSLSVAPNVWAWERGKATKVVLNMSSQPQDINGLVGQVEIGTNRQRDGEIITQHLYLEPWEGVVLTAVPGAKTGKQPASKAKLKVSRSKSRHR
ncbi:DUF3459 domain-containing protein [Patescibacteria group bacterium]|nr:MAG: DUF3459 domain-containing protein [Patescibacteria group bacterium]